MEIKCDQHVSQLPNMWSKCWQTPFGNRLLKENIEKTYNVGTSFLFSKWWLFSFHIFFLSYEVVLASNWKN